ncbi:MAG: hypothetical protein ABMB14_34375, partial [Myxococcota bacterium]
VPDAGVPFVLADTDVTVVRISDPSDPLTTGTDFTNGYSRWSPASASGAYALAFGVDGASSVYRLADRTVVRHLPIGEPNELQWDPSGDAGTDGHLYYRDGAALRRIDVLTGDDLLVHDFSVEYPDAGAALNGVEGAPSRDGRTWAFQVCDRVDGGGQCVGLLDIVTYDLPSDTIVGRMRDAIGRLETPNFVDVSPSGSKVVVGSCKLAADAAPPFDGPYAYDLDFTNPVRLGTDCTHSGWGWGRAGEELYVSFDACGRNNEEVTRTCDYLMAVDVNDPDGWNHRFGTAYAGDLGWDVGTHFGRTYDADAAGWIFVSTYDGTGWAADQLLAIELVPEADGPRVVRFGSSLNRHQDYWSEGFASLDFDAQHVYWGANWDGAGPLALYQSTLCTRWWEAADAAR